MQHQTRSGELTLKERWQKKFSGVHTPAKLWKHSQCLCFWRKNSRLQSSSFWWKRKKSEKHQKGWPPVSPLPKQSRELGSFIELSQWMKGTWRLTNYHAGQAKYLALGDEYKMERESSVNWMFTCPPAVWPCWRSRSSNVHWCNLSVRLHADNCVTVITVITVMI